MVTGCKDFFEGSAYPLGVYFFNFIGIPIHPILSKFISQTTKSGLKSDLGAKARVGGLLRVTGMLLTVGFSNENVTLACHLFLEDSPLFLCLIVGLFQKIVSSLLVGFLTWPGETYFRIL